MDMINEKKTSKTQAIVLFSMVLVSMVLMMVHQVAPAFVGHFVMLSLFGMSGFLGFYTKFKSLDASEQDQVLIESNVEQITAKQSKIKHFKI